MQGDGPAQCHRPAAAQPGASAASHSWRGPCEGLELKEDNISVEIR